jgi:hypothetical protein
MIMFQNPPEYLPCSLIGGGLHSLIPPKRNSGLPAAASPPPMKEQAAHVALAAELLVLKQRMSSLESERARLSAEAASLREEVKYDTGHRTAGHGGYAMEALAYAKTRLPHRALFAWDKAICWSWAVSARP